MTPPAYARMVARLRLPHFYVVIPGRGRLIVPTPCRACEVDAWARNALLAARGAFDGPPPPQDVMFYGRRSRA